MILESTQGQKNRNARFTNEQAIKICAGYLAAPVRSHYCQDMADKFRCSTWCIKMIGTGRRYSEATIAVRSEYYKKHGGIPRFTGVGEQNASARFSNKQAIKICEEFWKNRSDPNWIKRTAIKYGVSKTCIYYIGSGGRYATVTKEIRNVYGH